MSKVGPMPEHLHLVFSRPPEWLSDDEYNQWYDFHLGEILVVPGFMSARRFRLETARGSIAPSEMRFLSMYEIEGDPREVMVALDEERASGRMDLPSWFPEIRFASFNCLSHGNPTAPRSAPHLYIVFSAPPSGVPGTDYVDWYRTHMAENLTAEGFLTGWRFRLEPVVVDALGPTAQDHLALYQVEGELAELRAALRAAADSGAVHFPEWFDQIPFVSFDANAIGPRVPAPDRPSR